MRKYLAISEEAVSHIWLCNQSLLNFLSMHSKLALRKGVEGCWDRILREKWFMKKSAGLNHLTFRFSDLFLCSVSKMATNDAATSLSTIWNHVLQPFTTWLPPTWPNLPLLPLHQHRSKASLVSTGLVGGPSTRVLASWLSHWPPKGPVRRRWRRQAEIVGTTNRFCWRAAAAFSEKACGSPSLLHPLGSMETKRKRIGK